METDNQITPPVKRIEFRSVDDMVLGVTWLDPPVALHELQVFWPGKLLSSAKEELLGLDQTFVERAGGLPAGAIDRVTQNLINRVHALELKVSNLVLHNQGMRKRIVYLESLVVP